MCFKKMITLVFPAIAIAISMVIENEDDLNHQLMWEDHTALVNIIHSFPNNSWCQNANNSRERLPPFSLL